MLEWHFWIDTHVTLKNNNAVAQFYCDTHATIANNVLNFRVAYHWVKYTVENTYSIRMACSSSALTHTHGRARSFTLIHIHTLHSILNSTFRQYRWCCCHWLLHSQCKRSLSVFHLSLSLTMTIEHLSKSDVQCTQVNSMLCHSFSFCVSISMQSLDKNGKE